MVCISMFRKSGMTPTASSGGNATHWREIVSVMPASPDIAQTAAVPVVIPFYKDRRQLDLCLAALAQQDTPVEIWVYDNSVVNLFYTGAMNLGLKRAIQQGHAFVLLLTQDCYFRPNAISQLLE